MKISVKLPKKKQMLMLMIRSRLKTTKEEIAVGDDETIDDNLTELTGTNDLDDLSGGDIEK